MGLKGWSQTSVGFMGALLLYLVGRGFHATGEAVRTRKRSPGFVVHFPARPADVLVFQSYRAETGTESCTSPPSAFIPAPTTKAPLVPVVTPACSS